MGVKYTREEAYTKYSKEIDDAKTFDAARKVVERADRCVALNTNDVHDLHYMATLKIRVKETWR
jgi:hypothetical protein